MRHLAAIRAKAVAQRKLNGIIRDYEEASQNSGRTVQAIVADLEAVGHITRDRPDGESS